ncbi:MAG: efflux RND transporter periplasmic adaptor subunit [Pirellulaceae bacterium]
MNCPANKPHFSQRAGHPRGNAIVVTLVVLAVVAIAIYVGIKIIGGMLSASNDQNVQWQFTTVERKPFQHVVIEQGDIESSSNVEVECTVRSRNSSGVQIIWVIAEGERVINPTSATVSGIVTMVSERVGNECTITVETEDGNAVDHLAFFAATTEVLVEVGEEVSSGALLTADKLVELDSSALEDEENRQQIAVNQASSALISANASVEKAVIARKEYLEGTFRQDVQLMSSEILVQEENVNRAKDNFKFSTRLAAQGFLTEQQLKADEFAVQKSEIDLNLAMGRLKTLEEITKQKMLVGFDSDIETARASQDTAQKNLVEEQAELKLIGQQIVNCLVYAPAGGQVVHANKQSSRSGSEFIVEPGATVRERQTIIYLPDTDKMQVKAKVNEGRVPYVRVGQAVKVKVGALEGQELDGIVEKVNPYAEPTGYFSSGVKEYATFIRIIDPPTTIRTGMSAEVSIYVKSENNALQVPVQVLHEESTELYCLVWSNAEGEEIFTDDNGREFSVAVRELSFDTSNEKTLVVSGGLKEKERVVRNPRLHEDILNRLVYNHRAQWLLDQLDSNGDKMLTREELEANKFETILETIIDAVMVTDSSDGTGELTLSDMELGDGQLELKELAVFVEDGELYVNFKKQYLFAKGADKIVGTQDADKDQALNQGEFDKLTASIRDASAGDGTSLKKMVEDYGQYEIKESMLQVLGSASLADVDQNSNKLVGWYEMKRYLQTATLKKASSEASSQPSGGGQRQAAGGGAGRRPGGGDPAQAAKRMMESYDKDKDGKLSAEEAAAAPFLARFDTNKDGEITSQEVSDSIKKAQAAGGGGEGQRSGGQRSGAGGGQPRGGGGQ